MIRQAAFTGQGKLLKGALHCHTTRSDGKGDPGYVIRLHARYGYDFMALTDHRIYNYENYAPETNMTIIPGMEIDGNFPDGGVHCHHTVVIGPPKDQGNGFSQDQVFSSYAVETQADTQKVLDTMHDNGNLTIYCHPEWSNTPARDFDALRGNIAMELWNSGCAFENNLDNDAAYWDELLLQGQHIFGVAVDDGHPVSHHGNGWVRVNAENDVMSILAALKKGAFYASCGPEIYDFSIENGVAHVECSPAASIGFRYGYHPTTLVRGAGTPVIEADFTIPKHFTYLRVIVTDRGGCKAWSNPIWLDR